MIQLLNAYKVFYIITYITQQWYKNIISSFFQFLFKHFSEKFTRYLQWKLVELSMHVSLYLVSFIKILFVLL